METVHFLAEDPDALAVPGHREARSPTVRMKLSAFRERGLGCGLGDVNEALIESDGRREMFKLIGVTYDPSEPSVVITRWVPRDF